MFSIRSAARALFSTRSAARAFIARACSECGAAAAPADLVFCASCPAVLTPPLAANDESPVAAAAAAPLYDLFGLGAPRFALDVALLTERYRGLQKRLHPDVFCGARDEQVDAALQQSAWVNAAYGDLMRPYSRARHLLATHGVALASEETGPEVVDPSLLMHVMEVREDLEAARGAGDDDAVERIGEANRDALESTKMELAALFDDALEESGEVGGCDLNAALRATTRLRYLTTIHNEVYSLVDADA